MDSNLTPGHFAKQAYTHQTDKVRKSISYLIQECSHKLSFIDQKEVDLTLFKLTEIQKYSPEIHYLHHELQLAMRNQDPIGAGESLRKLIDTVTNYSFMDEYLSISSIGSLEWENFAVKDAARSMQEENTEDAIIYPVQEPLLSLTKDALNAAICTIARYDPETFDEICELAKVIKLFCGNGIVGSTDVRFYGAVLLCVPDQDTDPILYFIEQLVHEASHIYLNGLMAADPIVLNSSEDRFASPLRKNARPMTGVFHATYVSARILQSFLTLYLTTSDEKFFQPLPRILKATIEGVKEIKNNGILTPYGHCLINNISKLLTLFEHRPKIEDFNSTELKRFYVKAHFQRIAA